METSGLPGWGCRGGAGRISGIHDFLDGRLDHRRAHRYEFPILISVCRKMLGLATPAEIENIEQRLDDVALVWATLGYHQYSAEISLFRLHLDVIDQTSKLTGSERVEISGNLAEPTTERLSPWLGLKGALGLKAIAIGGAALGASKALQGRLLGSLGIEAATQWGMGSEIAEELLILVLRYSHALSGLEFDACFRILSPPTDTWTPLDQFLGMQPDSELSTWLLVFGNSATDVADSELYSRIRRSLASRVQAIQVPSYAQQAVAFMDLLALKRAIFKNQEVDPMEWIAKWNDRPKDEDYGELIRKLLKQSRVDSNFLMEEAAKVLRFHLNNGSTRPRTNAVLLLADDVADFLTVNGAGDLPDLKRLAVEAIQQELSRWARLMPPSTVLRCYEFLEENTDRQFAEDIRYFAALDIQEEQVRMLALTKSRQFFVAFKYWQERMQHWGLKALLPGNISESEIPALLRTWEEGNLKLPSPFTQDSESTAVNRLFLICGAQVFGAVGDAETEAVRSLFDEAAREALPELFQLIEALEDVPEDLLEIVAQHKSQLDRMP